MTQQLWKLGCEQRQKDAFAVYTWGLAHLPDKASHAISVNDILEESRAVLDELRRTFTTVSDTYKVLNATWQETEELRRCYQMLGGKALLEETPPHDSSAPPDPTHIIIQDYAVLVAEVTRVLVSLTALLDYADRP